MSMIRPAALALGILMLAAAWAGALPAWAPGAFSTHMTMHMAVVAIAAPLIALGVAGSRFDPVCRAPTLFSAIPASLVEFVVVWTWHAPTLHHAARHQAGALVMEQTMFLVTALVLWMAVLGGGPERRSTRAATGVIALLLTFMHMTLLGVLLAITPRVLYEDLDRSPGASSLADQQLGGVIMLLVGSISYLAGGLWLMATLVRRAAPMPAHHT